MGRHHRRLLRWLALRELRGVDTNRDTFANIAWRHMQELLAMKMVTPPPFQITRKGWVALQKVHGFKRLPANFIHLNYEQHIADLLDYLRRSKAE